MLRLMIFIAMILPVQLQAQERYYTKSGNISFFSEAPLEDIEAHNKHVVSFVDFKTGEMVFSVPMEAFEFRKSLMQRHFNENYVESNKYPKATFKGFISDIDAVNLSKDLTYPVSIEGELTLHGVTRKIKTRGTLDVKGKRVLGKSKFSVTPQEFNIEIPRIVRNNIAERIDITVDVLYEPYTGKNL